MDTSVEYLLMCLNANELQKQWSPQMGDYMLSKATYCNYGDDNSYCSKDTPCKNCLEMSNVWVVSDKFDYHESVGGTHWFFGGGLCVRGYGNMCNSTQSFVMTKERLNEEYGATVPKSEMLWLPRQDQVQSLLFQNDDLFINERIIEFYNFTVEIAFDPYRVTLEQLWLMKYMSEKHRKFWDGALNEWV